MTWKRMKKILLESAHERTHSHMNTSGDSFTFILTPFYTQRLSKYCLDAELPAIRIE